MVRARHIIKLLKILAVALFLYIEVFVYFTLPFYWSSRLDCSPGSCVNILLVADPQILGAQDTSSIARWDCDRFLARTFSSAINYAVPDIVIFLGDQMDEGHIASDVQFQSDFARFQSIFTVPEHISPPMIIHIPGDNDIGGEEDPILPHIVHRFEKHFDQSIEPASYQFLEFYKVNKITSMFQEPDAFNNDVVRVALSHVPLLRRIHTISKRVASAIKPHVIFSGHDHNSVHVSAPLEDAWSKKSEPILSSEKGWLHYAISDKMLHEIIVPTCSYRMGVAVMGYGFAHIDLASKTVSYSVLWLPPRLLHLFLYLGFLILVSIIFTCVLLANMQRRLRRFCQRLSSRKLLKSPTSMP